MKTTKIIQIILVIIILIVLISKLQKSRTKTTDDYGINPKPENETKAITNQLKSPVKQYELTGQQ